jgi:shikimate kinase
VTPRVVLVGLPATGKSTTGRRLAKILALPFADSDDLVEQVAGRSVPEVFADSGETAFRDLEQRAVIDALDGFDGVLALGGGALTRPDTRSALAASDAVVVLLEATVGTLTERVGDTTTRPLLAGDAAGRLGELAAERAPVYRSLASFAVTTDGHTPGQVAAHIAARLHKLGKAGPVSGPAGGGAA